MSSQRRVQSWRAGAGVVACKRKCIRNISVMYACSSARVLVLGQISGEMKSYCSNGTSGVSSLRRDEVRCIHSLPNSLLLVLGNVPGTPLLRSQTGAPYLRERATLKVKLGSNTCPLLNHCRNFYPCISRGEYARVSEVWEAGVPRLGAES